MRITSCWRPWDSLSPWTGVTSWALSVASMALIKSFIHTPTQCTRAPFVPLDTKDATDSHTFSSVHNFEDFFLKTQVSDSCSMKLCYKAERWSLNFLPVDKSCCSKMRAAHKARGVTPGGSCCSSRSVVHSGLPHYPDTNYPLITTHLCNKGGNKANHWKKGIFFIINLFHTC